MRTHWGYAAKTKFVTLSLFLGLAGMCNRCVNCPVAYLVDRGSGMGAIALRPTTVITVHRGRCPLYSSSRCQKTSPTLQYVVIDDMVYSGIVSTPTKPQTWTSS